MRASQVMSYLNEDLVGIAGGRKKIQTPALVIDLNFLYHPSCRYDGRWVCPLAPDDNTIDVPITAGERLGWV